MRVFLLIGCTLLLLGFGVLSTGVFGSTEESQVDSKQKIPSPAPEKKQEYSMREKKRALFVPYWTVPKNTLSTHDYDRLIYFGIGVTKQGIDFNDDGYKNLQQFLSIAEDKKEKYVTIRMVDSDTNSYILEHENLQKEIAQEAMTIAKENGFDGVVLDFELASLYFESVVKKINTLTAYFSHAAEQEQLHFAIALYGDVFHRARPYDVETLAKDADEVMIMAYDLHKARTNPGPNFPLRGKQIYGYDFATMITDFQEKVPQEKITVIYGLFGYDWVVDEKERAITHGRPYGFLEMKKRFLDTCFYNNCSWKRDATAQEIEARYEDSKGEQHRVWFEDMESVERKRSYLQENGIFSEAFWAYSYF